MLLLLLSSYVCLVYVCFEAAEGEVLVGRNGTLAKSIKGSRFSGEGASSFVLAARVLVFVTASVQLMVCAFNYERKGVTGHVRAKVEQFLVAFMGMAPILILSVLSSTFFRPDHTWYIALALLTNFVLTFCYTYNALFFVKVLLDLPMEGQPTRNLDRAALLGAICISIFGSHVCLTQQWVGYTPPSRALGIVLFHNDLVQTPYEIPRFVCFRCRSNSELTLL